MPRAWRRRSASRRRPGRGRPLATRLRDNGRVLLAAYRAIGAAIREERAITPAAEWLVDNFHVVEEQIREIRDDLPRGFYRQLPKLADGPLAGLSARLRTGLGLRRAHRQPVRPADAVPLRARLPARAAADDRRAVGGGDHAAHRAGRESAARGRADREQPRGAPGGRRPGRPAPGRRQRRGRAGGDRPATPSSRRPLPRAFAVQLVQRLRDQDPAVTPALRWLDERLAAQGTTADEIVREEHQRQGAMNVTVRNVITSMRLMSAVDWAELFESVSLVDAALRADSDFAAMDFPTRDRYRHAIEELARGSGRSELEVARRALLATARARRRRARALRAPRSPRAGSRLLPDRERAPRLRAGARISRAAAGLARARLRRRGHARLPRNDRGRHAPSSSRCRCSALAQFGVGGSALWLLALLALVPASDAAMALVNRHVTNQFGPTALPGTGAARRRAVRACARWSSCRRCLTTRAAIEEQIERLEVHHLASPDDDLRFALLSDWTDCRHRERAGRRGASRRRRRGHRALESTLRRRRRTATASSCSIAGGSGTRARGSGSAGSASAASCTS